MYGKVLSATVTGLSAQIVQVEVDAAYGIPGMELAGLSSSDAKGAKDRVRVALKNAGFTCRLGKVTVNLSPADLRKSGTGFDLAIAIGILLANERIPVERTKEVLFVGELGLAGQVRHVNGVLPLICEAREKGIQTAIVPQDDLEECSLIPGIRVLGATALGHVIDWIEGRIELKECRNSGDKTIDSTEELVKATSGTARDYRENALCSVDLEKLDFADVHGQMAAKRAALICAAGMHNLMLIGPPGSGKTMIAERIPGIMPELAFEERLELTKLYSIAGLLDQDRPFISKRPFRSPHFRTTQSAMIGGGTIPKPGEVTLASKGVLFLDEMAEFSGPVLETLRGPLEDKKVTIVRLGNVITYPADFCLVGAMNPCKCGYFPNRTLCKCSEFDIQRYMKKISRPVWDRFDICIRVERVNFKSLHEVREEKEWTTERMKMLVEKARAAQARRFAMSDHLFNSQMNTQEVKMYCRYGREGQKLMEQLFEKQQMTARGYYKVLKTARTVADIEGHDEIRLEDLSEALMYRSFRDCEIPG